MNMFGYLKSVFSYFWNEPDEDLSLEDAYNILNDGQEETKAISEAALEDEEYSCYNKTGTITFANNGSYSIDNKYEFKSLLENLRVGVNVAYTVYTTDNKVKVTDVTIQNDWICEGRNEKSKWCTRGLICKVHKRDSRQIFITPGNISVDLNKVAAEFIPIVGDWIDLQAKVELDENVNDLFGKILEVEKIRPLRPRILEGWVKQWCDKTKTGVIDKVVFFNYDALVSGYVPIIGDKVVTEVIESDQGQYTCRSLKILPQTHSTHNLTQLDSKFNNFVTEKENVFISGDIFINVKKLGESHRFLIEVSNKSATELNLLSVHLAFKNIQCKFVKPEVLSGIKIESGATINVEGLWTVNCRGSTRELILFSFEDCNVGRWITVNLEIPNTTGNQKTKYANRGSFLLAKTNFKLDNNMIRAPQTNCPPRFISVRLPDYPVPQKLLNIILKHESEKSVYAFLSEEISITKRCLTTPLAYHNYEDHFHTLLHLEEIFELISIKRYSQDCVCFIRNAEFLMLEIKNLSEMRPSLMIGDKIIAKDAYDVNAVEYEGHISKVGAKHVYIKFAHDFHDAYNDEDVSIMVVASRTVFRRMHQAVGLAIRNLGNSFLFPVKVMEKNPQVNFTYDKYYRNKDNIVSKKKQTRTDKAIEALKNHVSSNDVTVNVIDDDNSNLNKSKLLLPSIDDACTRKRLHFKPQTAPTQISMPVMKLEWYNNNLNYYQKEAVRNILLGAARPLPYIIFGPPGTGKTVTLVETILQILRLIPHSRLLVATPSNSSADLIALRLIESGVLKPGDLIRLVAYRCVLADMLPLKLIPYCATVDLGSEGTHGRSYKVAESGLTLGCNSSVIGRHRITVGTCTSLGSLILMGFSKGHFTHIIVDEAGQATEPEIMIPFNLIDTVSGQFILAGDPQQLGPVIHSQLAIDYGLRETYLDRMINRFPYSRDTQGFPDTGGYDPRLVTRLVYNYRSLPKLLTLASDMFYDGELIATISDMDSEEAKLLNSVNEILPKSQKAVTPPAVVVHGVMGENYQTADCPSWFNPNEASQVFYYVNELYRLGVKSKDIGIISPYIKQVKQIRELLEEAEFEVPKVGTVEEFQGQEFMVILLSTVRSNDTFKEYDTTYNLGFLANPRRLNVAITRARALMILIGNPLVLSTDLHWRSVINYAIDNGGYCGCNF